MGSRDEILARLRTAPKPFTDLPKRDAYLHMVPIEDKSPAALRKRFIEEAKKAACEVSEPTNSTEAIQQILTLFGDNKSVIAWDFAHIPLLGLADALTNVGVQVADVRDGSVKVGLTGADAALASTGSLVLGSGSGKSRQASLLPSLHIAVVSPEKIVTDLETWFDGQLAQGLEHFRSASAHVIISGPSRTADIAMELVMGIHGPTRVHIVILP